VVEYDPEALNGHFITGALSTIISYEPFSLQAEQSGGAVVATSATFPGCMPEGLGGRREVIASIPKEDLHKIIAGWFEAVAWSQDPANWEEYCNIVNKQTFAEPTPYESADIKAMLTNVSIHNPATVKLRNQAGGGLSQFIDETRNTLKGANQLMVEFSSAAVVDTSVLQRVLSDMSK
jgi:NitT/TauT family transport system substrate-binding protein